AATYALDHQDELAGIVLIGPAFAAGEQLWATRFTAARVLARAAPRLPLLKLDPDELTQDPAVARAYRVDPLVYHGRFDAWMLAQLAIAMRSVAERLGELRAPLLMLHGGSDLTADLAGSRRALELAGTRDKRLKIYDGMRHDLLNDIGHELVCGDIASWIQERIEVQVS
ncbi:MAG: serine aminopeptidase domain-containing protein, partial [Solirubrobacteraceae bacterium]